MFSILSEIFYVNIHKNHINVHYFNWDFYVNIHKNHINVQHFNWDFYVNVHKNNINVHRFNSDISSYVSHLICFCSIICNVLYLDNLLQHDNTIKTLSN